MLEGLAITLILGVLNTVIKNPSTKAQYQTQLLTLASDIAGAFGYTIAGSIPASSGSLSALESFAITIVIGTISQAIKSASTKAALQTQLLGICQDVCNLYGLTLEAPQGSTASLSPGKPARAIAG